MMCKFNLLERCDFADSFFSLLETFEKHEVAEQGYPKKFKIVWSNRTDKFMKINNSIINSLFLILSRSWEQAAAAVEVYKHK